MQAFSRDEWENDRRLRGNHPKTLGRDVALPCLSGSKMFTRLRQVRTQADGLNSSTAPPPALPQGALRFLKCGGLRR